MQFACHMWTCELWLQKWTFIGIVAQKSCVGWPILCAVCLQVLKVVVACSRKSLVLNVLAITNEWHVPSCDLLQAEVLRTQMN